MSQPSPPWRERLAGPALAAASMLLVLLVAEVALRLLGVGAGPPPGVRRMADARWRLLLDCYPSNPRGYFEIDLRTPASREAYHHVAPLRYDMVASLNPWAVESRYNALRFRDAPLGPKRKGARRVMILGDSFAEGEGVKEQDTCARVLGRLLDAVSPGRFEVRNCARRGTDFPELYEAFEEILPYEPDLVVYALTLNDAARPASFQARQTYVNDWILERGHDPDEPGPPGFWRSRLVGFVGDRVDAWRVGRETTRWYLEMWGEANAEGWAETQSYLREMKRQLEGRGARLLVAPWPLFVGLESAYPFTPAHETIARFCLRAGIAHHDLLPVFRGRRSSDFWVHPVDRHPNETAHRLAAESLAPLVRRLVEEP
jgi:lysophospholipase L1-like esterase